MGTKARRETADGYESHFGTNYMVRTDRRTQLKWTADKNEIAASRQRSHRKWTVRAEIQHTGLHGAFKYACHRTCSLLSLVRRRMIESNASGPVPVAAGAGSPHAALAPVHPPPRRCAAAEADVPFISHPGLIRHHAGLARISAFPLSQATFGISQR